MDQAYLTSGDLAKRLGVSQSTVQKWLQDEDKRAALGVIVVGGRWAVPVEAVEAARGYIKKVKAKGEG
jgi:excisionase family DNA binding protein